MAIVNPVSRKGCNYVQGVAPLSPEDGMTWFDTVNNRIEIYDATNSKWVSWEEISFDQHGYGYVCGGYSNNYISTIERFEFPIDGITSIHVGNLSDSKDSPATFNSSNYGYIVGGNKDNSSKTFIDRITFPFNSGTASHVGNLSEGRRFAASFNSSNYGYTCGSYQPGLSLINRLTFPFDSGTSSNMGYCSQTRVAACGFNCSQYGYTAGGSDGGGHLSTIDRITFPFDSGTVNHVGNLSGSNVIANALDNTDFVSQGLFV